MPIIGLDTQHPALIAFSRIGDRVLSDRKISTVAELGQESCLWCAGLDHTPFFF